MLQPIADGVKLLFKEIILPANANKALFLLAPVVMIMPALAAWAVIPFAPELVLSDINAGLLYIMALSSIGVYGVIIAGWASNSKYAFLGAMRSAAQMVSYELAMGFALVVVLMVSGSLNLSDIVEAQGRGYFASKGLTFLSWNWLPLLPMLVVYFVSGVAETNRAPFDVVEGESEIVAGHMVEYSGMTFALFFIAEYMNMMLISALTAVMFFGGWQAPVDSVGPQLDTAIRLVSVEDVRDRLDVPLDPRHLPALPLRPDHAPGLEGVHPADAGLDRGGRHLDADAVEPG